MASRIEVDLLTGEMRTVEQVGYLDDIGGLHYFDAGHNPGAGFKKCSKAEFEKLLLKAKEQAEVNE